MTRYQTPSQSFSSSDTPLNSGDFQPEDSSDLESRMARLVGLEEESPSSEEGSVSIKQPSVPEPQEPQELQTKQPLSSNPFAKLGVVGAATLAMVVVAGTFLTQLMSGTNNKPSSQNRSLVTQAPPQPKPESRIEQLERENEALKSKLALTEQAAAVKAAQQQLRNLKPETSRIALRPNPQLESRDSSRDKPRVIVQRIPAPPVVRTIYRDRIVTVDRPVRAPQAIARTPNPLPIELPPVPPPLGSSVEFTPPPDPLQEWARLAKLGSYGQVSTPDNQNTSNATIASRPNEIEAPQPLVTPRPPVRITPPENSTDSLVAQRRTKATKSTVVGTSAKATLVKGLYGTVSRGRESNNNNNNQIFVVRLREALKAEDGSVVIPANAELHTKVRSISEGGLLDIDVDKVIWEEKNGDRIEKTVPQDALTISGAGGKPPVATQYTGGGPSIGRDVMLFALGGAQKAAELPNRPRQKLVPVPIVGVNGENNGSTLVSQTDYNENIAAGILEGGTRSLIPELTRRTQQAQSQKAQRNNIWWIPAGTKVEVRVDRATQF
ncbi:hypothetical protein WA1_44445 [Scytonema hofmannii PCC 7110]|uniref:Conjugal transfer protein TrbI n=1 Tax=Scytonema hofmannii PCC 7110 TaxID=128403 RepID=A0A139WWH7_9CYAN|nr:TrbI/VirB10 family protein [Scytonema hofmannii]KYC36732.1 hypothetical protein WA1_44445 [Scytonema hofmannii PCC 7110]